jgi:prolyl 4-hydroxylase
LDGIFTYGTKRQLAEDEPRLLQQYRDPDQTVLNMTMTVLSCAPRVFEIKNFLSAAEVAHMLNIAGGVSLSLSSTGELSKGDKIIEPKGDTRKTRTSYNSWLPREKSPIIDAIYRRAADLMRIDEALLRHRGDGEYPDLGTEKSLAEQLQLVHYNVGQGTLPSRYGR